MQLVDGRALANRILEQLKQEVSDLPCQPVFCDVLIGDDPVARSYVNTKARAATQVGIKFELVELPARVTTEEVIAKLQNIQGEPNLCGLIIQLPLPAHLDKSAILKTINPRVDVDCLNQAENLLPPTAAAVMAVLESLNLDLSKLNILVIGQGELVGKPVTRLLTEKGFQVNIADQSTFDLKQLTQNADVIISATGKPKLITEDLIKPGVVLVDCGTSESKSSIVGDVDLESVSSKAAFVSPVPGGVGPVTVAKLLFNVVFVAKGKENV